MIKIWPQLGLQDGPKRTSRWPRAGQDGPKLSPSWPQVCPSSPLVSQDGSKLAPRAPQEPQEAPKTSNRDPQTALKNHNSSLDLVPIFKQQASKQASKQSRAKQASKQASKQARQHNKDTERDAPDAKARWRLGACAFRLIDQYMTTLINSIINIAITFLK